MINLRKIISILIALTIPAICGEVPAENIQVTYKDFTEAYWLHVTSPGTFVFKDNDSWYSFCSSFWDSSDFWPEVDFENYMIIGISWGQSGGCGNWANFIKAIYIKRGVIQVRIGHPDFGPCEMIIWPRQFIIMKKYDLPAEFHGCVPGEPE